MSNGPDFDLPERRRRMIPAPVRHRHLSALSREGCLPARRQPLAAVDNRSRSHFSRSRSAFGHRELNHPFQREHAEFNYAQIADIISKDFLRDDTGQLLTNGQSKQLFRSLSAPQHRSKSQTQNQSLKLCKDSRGDLLTDNDANVRPAHNRPTPSTNDPSLENQELLSWLEDLQLQVSHSRHVHDARS